MLKLPKPDIFTSSPASSVAWMRSKNASTMSFDSRLFRPSRSNNSSASSAFVSVGVTSVGWRLRGAGGSVRAMVRGWRLLRPQADAEPAFERRNDGGDDVLDALVGQGQGVVAQFQPQREAALTRGDAGDRTLGLVDIEQRRGSHHARRLGLNRGDDRIVGHGLC